MKMIYTKTKGLQETELHYCPGCSHGIVHKLIGEVMEELNIIDDTIAVCPVGCSVFAGNYFACDTVEASHGRAPAVATGIKRTHPDQPVFTYQGDGDLGRKIYNCIYQQWNLWYDRRTDGADDSDWTEGDHSSVGAL